MITDVERAWIQSDLELKGATVLMCSTAKLREQFDIRRAAGDAVDSVINNKVGWLGRVVELREALEKSK
mgnify:CR=1 FL=1